jgi:hypothetical protein
VPRQEAPPTAVVQLQQPTPLAPRNTNLLTPPTTPRSQGPPPATPGSQTSPRCRYRPCSLCGRMGHLPTQCQHYYCHYCKTLSPGHFAKFCPRNPHAGLECRDLPPSALTMLIALVVRTRPLASDQLLYPMSPSLDLPAYSPESPPYSLVITLSTPSNLPPLQQLPWDPLTVPSTPLHDPHVLLAEASILDASRHPSLPPIITLDKMLNDTLPVSHRLLTSMQPNDPHCQSMMMAITNLITTMSHSTTS